MSIQNTLCSNENETKLMRAIRLGLDVEIRELADDPTELNTLLPLTYGQYHLPRSALEYAVRMGDADNVAFLLRQGAKQFALTDDETLIEVVDMMIDKLCGGQDYCSRMYFLKDNSDYSIESMLEISRLLRKYVGYHSKPSSIGMYQSSSASSSPRSLSDSEDCSSPSKSNRSVSDLSSQF